MNGVRLRSAAVLAILLIALSGCKAEPGSGSTPGTTPGATTSSSTEPTATANATPSTATEPTTAPTTSPEPTATAAPTPSVSPADIALPGDCAALYSPAMLATLQAEGGPLNDPGLTLGATGVEGAYAVLDQAVAAGQSLRCTWGVPSEVGLATHVSLIDDAQADAVISALQSSGLTCAAHGSGTLCRIVVDTPDEEGGHVWGESHYLAGNAWVATAWLNFGPDGYTEDIVTTLWG